MSKIVAQEQKFGYLQKRGLAIIVFDDSLGSDGPALLTAIIRNSYSLPSLNPPHEPRVCVPSISAPCNFQIENKNSTFIPIDFLLFAIDHVLFLDFQ